MLIWAVTLRGVVWVQVPSIYEVVVFHADCKAPQRTKSVLDLDDDLDHHQNVALYRFPLLEI